MKMPTTPPADPSPGPKPGPKPGSETGSETAPTTRDLSGPISVGLDAAASLLLVHRLTKRAQLTRPGRFSRAASFAIPFALLGAEKALVRNLLPKTRPASAAERPLWLTHEHAGLLVHPTFGDGKPRALLFERGLFDFVIVNKAFLRAPAEDQIREYNKALWHADTKVARAMVDVAQVTARTVTARVVIGDRPRLSTRRAVTYAGLTYAQGWLFRSVVKNRLRKRESHRLQAGKFPDVVLRRTDADADAA